MRFEDIPTPAVYRLSFYLRQLEAFQHAEKHTISSRQLGEALGYTDAQVRKDLAYFGQFGHPGIGYRVEELISQLRKILGTDKVWNVLLVGAGNLGRALIAYRGFLRKGFRLAAIFDADPRKAGQAFGELTIRGMSELPAATRELGIRLAIMSVPSEAAQGVAEMLVAAGIRGILNFAPVSVTVPKEVSVQSVDLAVQLEQLSFQMSLADEPVAESPHRPS
ncbi:MAG TPA: redox-sensing transcriptional repressor Rex [Phycisphaerae bacterium]|nr:redox-sensing transcriptional repressor Rex [Phycisphaerae bacterium]